MKVNKKLGTELASYIRSDEARMLASALTHEAIADGQAHGDRPALICGDFQNSLTELHACRYAEAAGWADVGAGRPTCDQAAIPRRIDLCVANPALLRRLRCHKLHRWEGVRTHAAQMLVLA